VTQRREQRVDVLPAAKRHDRGAAHARAGREEPDHQAERLVDFAGRVGALAAQPAPQDVIVRRDHRGRHELGPQRSGLRGVGQPAGDELPEEPLVPGDDGDLPVPQRRNPAGERVPAPGQVTLVNVVQQDQPDRVGDRNQGGAVAGSPQPLLDLL
jgi:hypothetical protein